jgi:hypothetical protein
MYIRIYFIYIILNFLLYYSRKTLYIPGVTINTANNEKYYGLPNEIPAMSSIFENIKNKNIEKYNAIKSISNIIGSFPLSEQYALYKSVLENNDEKIFDKDTYQNYMKENKIFDKQIESVNNYLTAEENRKILSLGAIKKVAAQFGLNSNNDENVTEKINQNIYEILEAQNLLNKHENDFLNYLFEVFNKRRNYLFKITTKNYNKNDEDENTEKYFLRDENNNNIKGFLYNKDDAETIVKYFKNFALIHHYYNNILNYNSILAQIYIGQLDKCGNFEENNPDAGKSSNTVNRTEKTKNGNKVGVNVNENIRDDRKTLNNYDLNYGFGLGKILKKIEKTDEPYRFNILNGWEEKLNDLYNEMDSSDLHFEDSSSSSISESSSSKSESSSSKSESSSSKSESSSSNSESSSSNSESDSDDSGNNINNNENNNVVNNKYSENIDIEKKFKNLFSYLLNSAKEESDSIEYKPFMNLARYILETSFENDDATKLKLDKEILQIYEQDNPLSSSDKQFIAIKLKNNKLNKKTNIKEFKDIKFKYACENNENNLCFDSFIVYFKAENDEKYLYALAKYKNSNSIFYDLYINGTSYTKTFYDTITACFSAFSSLGKDDKDACRGVLTNKCGKELDYRCKESGFYDVISQNPVADNILPQKCLEIDEKYNYNYDACLKWLEIYFIKNGLTIKPSAMGSFSLLMQSASRGYDSIKTRSLNIFGDNEDPINEDSTDSDSLMFDEAHFSIQGTSDSNSNAIQNLMSQVDKAYYMQINKSLYLKYSYLFLLLIIFLFN